MISLRLNKPLYEWRTLGRSQGSDLFLSQAVEEWLVGHDINYETRTDVEEHQNKDTGTIGKFLIFYLDIEHDNHAMLFKLTWM
jgi:hypothetical protein